MRHGIAACFVLLLGSLCMGDAQAAAVCPDPPGTAPGDGNWIACEKASTSNDDISIDVDGVAISTTAASTPGIKAEHAGGTSTDSGDITIDVDGTATKKTISTTGNTAEGILGKHTGTGDVDIDVTGVGITTSGTDSSGVHGAHTGTGDVDIDVEDITITPTGSSSLGIYSKHTGTGDMNINATGISILTGGVGNGSQHGVSAQHDGTGNIVIDFRGKTTGTTTVPSTITTGGGTMVSSAISAQRNPSANSMTGNITITLEDTEITSSNKQNAGVGDGYYAVYGHLWGGRGTVTATLNSGTIITTTGRSGTGVHLTNATGRLPDGMARTSNVVTLTAGAVTVKTTGESSYGL